MIQVQADRAARARTELPRRAADIPAQRTGQMGLVEVLEPGDNAGDRETGGQ